MRRTLRQRATNDGGPRRPKIVPNNGKINSRGLTPALALRMPVITEDVVQAIEAVKATVLPRSRYI